MAINQFKSLCLVAISWMTLFSFGGSALTAADNAECTAGKLSDYQRLGSQGCVIGDTRFANFTYRRAADGLPAEAICVTPGTVPDSDDPALLFEARWAAPSFRGSYITYSVEVLPSGRAISRTSLEMQFGQIAGTGEASVASEVRLSRSGPAASGSTADSKLKVFLGPNGAKKAVDHGQLTVPVREMSVMTSPSVAAGKNGEASLKGFMEVFHSIPLQPASASDRTGTLVAGGGAH